MTIRAGPKDPAATHGCLRPGEASPGVWGTAPHSLGKDGGPGPRLARGPEAEAQGRCQPPPWCPNSGRKPRGPFPSGSLRGPGMGGRRPSPAEGWSSEDGVGYKPEALLPPRPLDKPRSEEGPAPESQEGRHLRWWQCPAWVPYAGQRPVLPSSLPPSGARGRSRTVRAPQEASCQGAAWGFQ